jgi:hypothetical protein
MDEATRRDIEWDCSRLCVEYARRVDFKDYEGFAALFAEDGILEAGVRVQGRATILKGLKQRDEKLRSRHVMTNIAIDVVDDEHATGIAYLSLHRHVGPESDGDAPVPLAGPFLVGHYVDAFVRTAEGWRFAERVLHMDFLHAAPSAERPKG